jgi:hypothetical protein
LKAENFSSALKNYLSHYNTGVVVVNSEVELAPAFALVARSSGILSTCVEETGASKWLG